MATPKTPNTGEKTRDGRFPYNGNDGTQSPNTQNDVKEPDWYNKSKDNNKNAASSGSVRNQSSGTPHGQNMSVASQNQASSEVDRKCEAMLNTTVFFNNQPHTIKGQITCNDKRLFAVEASNQMSTYTGKCPECQTAHFPLESRKGYYMEAKDVFQQMERNKLVQVREKGRTSVDELPSCSTNRPPLDRPILGKEKGIEGDSNSCYMDSTIFCMFAYSGVFDTLLHMPVDNKSIKKVQTLLRENIVNVLRDKPGLVERDALFHFRQLLSDATNDKSFKEMEKDPSEFLRALEQLFHYAPLKTVPPDQPPQQDQSNVTTNIIWEMFDANPKNLPYTNIAGIFRNSLAEIPAKLASVPPFLVLIAPRHARSQRSYRYIIPDRHILLDREIVQHICLNCKQTNHNSEQSRDLYFCNQCYDKGSSSLSSSAPTPSTDATVKCYCSGCLKQLHDGIPNSELVTHEVKQMKTTAKLNLFAVLCIETSHYVAFVKCHKQDQQDEWIFFDSMSDRIHNEKNVPCVSRVSDFDQWIDEAKQNKYFFEDLDRRRNQGKPLSQAFTEDGMRQLRLFRDGAFFFYENADVNYH